MAIMDVPGAFMQVDMDETVHICFIGEMVCILLEIDTDLCQEYITIEKGEKVIYVKLLKALYGTLELLDYFGKNFPIFSSTSGDSL